MEAFEPYMLKALGLARQAADLGEVPVGCVVIRDGEVIGEGYNRREIDKDPLAHAEMAAIRMAARNLGSWRLEGCQIVVTLEPCAMCAGAIVLARLETLVFGADDPKAGYCGSLGNIVEDPRLNHRPTVIRGVLQDTCSTLLTSFFRELRSRSDR
ncbi:MAG TPA: tRNA adenosine(34) deaminase TadA [Thermoanaerobaculia bacterium]|nr:tRNA adenosine(34) deaminase TadA [Thermoanaerobaculia bacterium]HUM29139.1 tRNA adenosine(34) deaminase TadA [Thermoanaerobaculia bacterium]HXK67516.1 tRNA adenosine(34) deaminase TadA [Thermoanaerobaculia bacterium]